MITANTFRLDGQLALVTGSSSGIGLALARGLGQAGAALVLNGRDAAKLAATAATLRNEGVVVHELAFDVTDAAASKGAVKMLTKGMAIDLGPYLGPCGITVNGIGPGYFKSELTQKRVDDPTFSAWLIKRTPSRRWGDVEDLAPAAVFLASEAGRFVNGHILYVDGGVTATL